MAGEPDAALLRRGDDAFARGRHECRLVGAALGEIDGEFLIGPDVVVLLAPEGAIELDIVPLPLARRVIHHREQPHERIVDMRFEDRQQAGIREFAAEVEIVIGLQQPAIAGRVDAADGCIQHGRPRAAGVVVTERQGIEHGGDAAAQHLPVMGQHRRHRRRPAHARPRLEVVLDVVGVDVDQSGDQVVALEIDLGCARVLAGGNQPISNGDIAGHHLVGQHDPRVDEGRRHSGRVLVAHQHPRHPDSDQCTPLVSGVG